MAGTPLAGRQARDGQRARVPSRAAPAGETGDAQPEDDARMISQHRQPEALHDEREYWNDHEEERAHVCSPGPFGREGWSFPGALGRRRFGAPSKGCFRSGRGRLSCASSRAPDNSRMDSMTTGTKDATSSAAD